MTEETRVKIETEMDNLKKNINDENLSYNLGRLDGIQYVLDLLKEDEMSVISSLLSSFPRK